MFAYDTNLFYEHKDLKTLFSLVNQELQKLMNGLRQINSLLTLEKVNTYFSINQVEKMIFHKPSRKDDLPLLLPRLLIKKHKVERVKSIKFLGVLLDENLPWKDHIKYIENEVAKTLVYYIGPNYF